MAWVNGAKHRPGEELLYSSQSRQEYGCEPENTNGAGSTGHCRCAFLRQLTSGPESQLIAEPLVSDLLHQNDKKLIFDLTGVEQIDSTGANIIVQCFLAARQAAAELRVAGASGKVARVFKITRLDAVIPSYPTVAAACEGFTVTPNTSE